MLRRIRSWIKRKNAGTQLRFHAEIEFLNLDVISVFVCFCLIY